MAKEEKYYVDADVLKQLLMEIPGSISIPSLYLSSQPGSMDEFIDKKITQYMDAISRTIMNNHTTLMLTLANAIDAAKKPYTQCMLCCSNGQKTIDDIEQGEG